jgi:hypothetical protein
MPCVTDERVKCQLQSKSIPPQKPLQVFLKIVAERSTLQGRVTEQ